jgi:hypothetical protein
MTKDQVLRIKAVEVVKGFLPPQNPDFLSVVDDIYRYLKDGVTPSKVSGPGPMPMPQGEIKNA